MANGLLLEQRTVVFTVFMMKQADSVSMQQTKVILALIRNHNSIHIHSLGSSMNFNGIIAKLHHKTLSKSIQIYIPLGITEDGPINFNWS